MGINKKRKWGKINKQGFAEHIEPKKVKTNKSK